MRRTAQIKIVVVTLIAAGCYTSPGTPDKTAAGSNTTFKAFVTILPQVDFVRRIGKDRVAVEVLVGPGQSHHTYEPTARQMTALTESQIYFSIGVPCELSLIPKITEANRRMLLVDTSRGVKFREDKSGDGHGHEHEDHDPHIWLDPRLVVVQAGHIRDGLKQVDPQNASFYDQNCAEFVHQLNDLHAQLSAQFAAYKDREILVFHPAYGYFTDAYGIKQLAVELDGKEPAVRYLTGLIDKAKAAGISTVFIQPQFPVASASTIASALHGKTVPLDPMTNDYLKDMREMARLIINSFPGRIDPTQTTAAVKP